MAQHVRRVQELYRESRKGKSPEEHNLERDYERAVQIDNRRDERREWLKAQRRRAART
jgi:hypothetical protein